MQVRYRRDCKYPPSLEALAPLLAGCLARQHHLPDRADPDSPRRRHEPSPCPLKPLEHQPRETHRRPHDGPAQTQSPPVLAEEGGVPGGRDQGEVLKAEESGRQEAPHQWKVRLAEASDHCPWHDQEAVLEGAQESGQGAPQEKKE